eukprot:m.229109 g.229109  ORF g.229109 m.229109 type:complete len:354 (-) comp11853_c0_seq1:1953-3014(-)
MNVQDVCSISYRLCEHDCGVGSWDIILCKCCALLNVGCRFLAVRERFVDGLIVLPVLIRHRWSQGRSRIQDHVHCEHNVTPLLQVPVRRDELRIRQQSLEVCTRQAVGRLRQPVQVGIRAEHDVLGHGGEDCGALAAVGHGAVDEAVQPPGPQQGRIDQIGAAGRRKDVHARRGLHAVELREQLVDDAVGDTRAVMASLWGQRLKLVEEQNARGCVLSTGEEIADGLLAGADVLAQQLRALDANEVKSALLGDRACKHCLSGPVRPVEQHAGAQAQREGGEDAGILGGPLERLDQHLLGVGQAANVRPTALRLVQGHAAQADGGVSAMRSVCVRIPDAQLRERERAFCLGPVS